MNELTKKQKQVLRLRADGYLNKQISSMLEISEVTIHQHLRACCKKLEATNTAHAIFLASQAGIIGDAPPSGSVVVGDGKCLELTERDKQILQCVAKGDTNTMIASQLGIELTTLESHFQRMALRNGMKGRMPLAMSALKAGQVVL